MTVTCLVVMGVSGAGKTTVARVLADRLGWPMAEGDDFHPETSVAKMRAGVPLTDADREPWLRTLRKWIEVRAEEGQSSVMTCSALKQSYRDMLRGSGERASEVRVRFLHLQGDEAEIGERMVTRTGHFMPTTLLESQLADLEPLGPEEDGVVVDVDAAPEALAETALRKLGLEAEAAG